MCFTFRRQDEPHYGKTSILFGAGASCIFFNPKLTTDYLTKELCEVGNWQRVVERYLELDKGSASSNVARMAPSICSILDTVNTLRSLRQDLNFEHIIDVLDKISSISFDRTNNGKTLHLLMSLLKRFACLKWYPYWDEGWGVVPFLAREIIAEAIMQMESFHHISQYGELINLQSDFIKYIDNHSHAVSIVSLNYDDVLLESTPQFSTCFDCPTRRQNIFCLDVNRFFKEKRVIYFPHGQLRFIYSDTGEAWMAPDARQAEELRWEGLDNKGCITVRDGQFAYDFNTFIATGRTKDGTFNDLPYAAYYQRLAADTASGSLIVIVGYSFGDPHINRLFSTFLQINDCNKVLIVDLCKSEMAFAPDNEIGDDILKKIQTVFGTPVKFVGNHDGGKPVISNQAQYDKLKSEGLGQIFDRVYFYKKGYEKFLKEYSRVIKEIS